MFQTLSNFEATFLAALHDGEKEGITILKAKADSGMVFCTGDMIAIESLGMLGLSDVCVRGNPANVRVIKVGASTIAEFNEENL